MATSKIRELCILFWIFAKKLGNPCTGGPDALPGGVCSHRRAYFYYLHSIREPSLFPSFACSSLDDCTLGAVHPELLGAFMGESAQVCMEQHRYSKLLLRV